MTHEPTSSTTGDEGKAVVILNFITGQFNRTKVRKKTYAGAPAREISIRTFLRCEKNMQRLPGSHSGISFSSY